MSSLNLPTITSMVPSPYVSCLSEALAPLRPWRQEMSKHRQRTAQRGVQRLQPCAASARSGMMKRRRTHVPATPMMPNEEDTDG